MAVQRKEHLHLPLPGGFTGEYTCRDLKEECEFASYTSWGKHSGQKEQCMQRSEGKRSCHVREHDWSIFLEQANMALNEYNNCFIKSAVQLHYI